MTAIEISTDPARLDVALIHAFLANDSYWVKGISRASVEICIKNSLCFGVYGDGGQLAFARVVIYAQFGFAAPANPERQMELMRPNTLSH